LRRHATAQAACASARGYRRSSAARAGTWPSPARPDPEAREAAGAALRHAREVLGRREIISIIRPGNAASVRVATALGAVRSHPIEFAGGPADVHRYPAEPSGGG